MLFKDRKRRIWLTVKLVLDTSIALSSFVAAFAVRYGEDLAHPVQIISGLAFAPYRQIFFMVPVIRVVCSFMSGLYRQRNERNKIDSIFTVFKAVSLGSLIIVVLLFTYRGFFEYRAYSYSRLFVLMDLCINLTLVAGSRAIIGYVDGWLKFSGIGLKKVLFVGYTDEVGRIIGEMTKDVRLGCKVVGYVGEENPALDVPYLGTKGGLVNTLQEKAVDEVYVLDTYFTQEELLNVSGWCDKLDTDLRLIPSHYMVMSRNAVVDEIAGIPTILVKKGGIRGWDRILKEVEDYVLSLLLLLVLSPLMLITGLIVVLDSRGPVFFRQERVGKNGKRFYIYKFRSMLEDAEKMKEALMETNEAQGPIFKMRNDPRITRVGRFIRKTSIDELPQLFNVLRGEMSLVGPRPPIPSEVAEYEDWQKERLSVLPGITGLWQVSGRHAFSFEDMVKWDIYYIRNWSVWLDLKILIRTIPVVIISKGAY